MITKKDVDFFFTKNYSDLSIYAKKNLSLKNKKYDPSIVVSEAYINVIKCVENGKITNVKEIEMFAKSTIYSQINWSNSYINNYHKRPNTINIDFNSINTNDSELDNIKTPEEIIIYLNQSSFSLSIETIKNTLDKFSNTLNLIYKVMFDLIYTKDMSSKQISIHLSIPLSTVYKYKQILNKQLKEFINSTDII